MECLAGFKWISFYIILINSYLHKIIYYIYYTNVIDEGNWVAAENIKSIDNIIDIIYLGIDYCNFLEIVILIARQFPFINGEVNIIHELMIIQQ